MQRSSQKFSGTGFPASITGCFVISEFRNERFVSSPPSRAIRQISCDGTIPIENVNRIAADSASDRRVKLTGLIPLPARKAYRATRRLLRKRVPWLRSPPPPGYARLHKWRSVRPIRRNFGWDTGGRCVDRYYIEGFLESNRDLIRGRVLEVAENHYTLRFGGDKVTRSDILHVAAGTPGATIIGNLATGEGIPEAAFDCIILTQVLFCIFDLPSVVRTIFKSLAPGGVVLITEPGISQIARYDMEQWGDCWRFTSCSASKLFSQVFPPDHVMVETRGNVLSSIAFLHGLLATELTRDELDYQDPDYQMSVLIKATKPGLFEENAEPMPMP